MNNDHIADAGNMVPTEWVATAMNAYWIDAGGNTVSGITAAIAAVAPLIAAQERERCAAVADARYAHHKAVGKKACFGMPQKLVLLSFSQSNYAEAKHIAAAIGAIPDDGADA